MSKIHPLKRLLNYASQLKSKIYLASTFSVCNKLFDIAPEILIGVAVDLVVKKENSWIGKLGIQEPVYQLLTIGVLTFIIWASESFFQFLHQVNWREIAQELQHALRLDAFNHVQKLDLSWFEDQSTGNLLTILNDDINQLERFINEGANEIIQVIISTVVIGAIFFFISPLIALIAFAPIPLILFGAFFFQKKLNPLYMAVRDKAGFLSGRLQNSIAGVATIKSFVAEDFELKNLEKDSLAYQDANKKAIKYASAFVPTIRIGVLSGFVVTLVLGGYLTFEGQIAIGSYSILIFLTQRLLWPLTRLGQTADNYERSMASTQRIMDLIEKEIEIFDSKDVKEIEDINGKITFKAVDFSYKSGGKILNDLNLEINPGSFVGIVGGTGSGKSTLIKLILRFFDPSNGSVYLDDYNLKELSLKSIRSKIGFVSQDVFLFHGTVLENIAYSTPNVSREKVIEAAIASEAHDFIMSLQNGYETFIGERGQKLSGGQRQRISIARAILKDPKILILDEATSAVDNETEAAIQKSLEKIAIGRTTIVVAHRLSTIRKADCIYVMEDGAINSFGKHDDLISRSEYYKRLWSIQTGGY